MKKCPFCAEEIQEAAVICKHCRQSLVASAPPGGLNQKLSWRKAVLLLLAALLTFAALAWLT
jgi:hypothetical protein